MGQCSPLFHHIACRTRLNAFCRATWHSVQTPVCSNKFPLASPLSSIASATSTPALFGDFSGTMGLSDFPHPYIPGVPPRGSQGRPWRPSSRPDMGSPGSRVSRFRACTRSPTAQSPEISRDSDISNVAFRTVPQRRHSKVK